MTSVASNYKLKRGSVTLPSVFDWGGAPRKGMNILRDPPKSITTLRIDKPSMTSMINEQIDGSGDRSCESINVYPRGINPMVSVSYSNNSNSAGAYVSVGNNYVNGAEQNTRLNIPNSSLPYKSMNNGEFRPPVRTQRDLQPLSHLNRLPYDIMSKPGFVDFSKTKYCPTIFRQIKDLIQTGDVNTGKSQKIEKPIQENYKMSEVINEKHINVSAGSNVKTTGRFERDDGDMFKGINHTIIEAWADTNPNQNRSHNISEMVNMDTDKYIQNTLQYEVPSASHLKPGVTFIGEMGEPIQERNLPEYQVYSASSNPRINKRLDYENDIQLERTLPQTSALTNRPYVERLQEPSIPEFKLPPTLKKDSFYNQGVMPNIHVNNQNIHVRTRNDQTDIYSRTQQANRQETRMPGTRTTRDFAQAQSVDVSPSEGKLTMKDYINAQQFGRWQ